MDDLLNIGLPYNQDTATEQIKTTNRKNPTEGASWFQTGPINN